MELCASQREDGLWKMEARETQNVRIRCLPTNFYIMSTATTMREIRAEVLEMSENMLTPAQTLWRQTSRPNQTLPPKDNYSINQELVHTEALELRDFLIVRGYIVLYRKTTGNTINKLFVTHNKCIERISQIVIMGAAYKTARNEVPFVNIIGVDYLAPNYSSKSLRSFYIGLAVLTNERQPLVFRHVKSTIQRRGRWTWHIRYWRR